MARLISARSTALGLLTFGLLTTTSLIQPVTSAQAATAQANSSWTINRVASMASGSYCTMAQKYSDDTILTFAKNQAGEYSLAFDFLKPQFPEAKTTTVSLRPGNGSAQTFSVDPQNDKVIVIGIGADEKFVSAVKSSNKIDLETNGQAHNYVTSQFAAAATELTECVSSMKPSAPMAAAPTPAAAPTAVASAAPVEAPKTAVAPAAAPLPKTITASLAPQPAEQPRMIANPDVKPMRAISPENNQISDLQMENAQLKQALAQSRQSYETAQNNSQASMASELQEKYQAIQKENEILKSQKTVAPDMSQELARIRAELTSTQARNQELQSQAAQLNAQQKDAILATQQLAELQKQNGQMKIQLDTANQSMAQLQAKSAQSSAAALQLSALQTQNAQMKTQIETATQTIAQLQAKTIQSASAAEQVAALQKQNADIKAQADAANKVVAELQAKAAQAAGVSEQMAVLQKQNADIKAQLATATQTITQLQTKVAQAPVVDPAANAALAENASLKQQIAQLQNVKAAPVVNPAANAALAENAALKQQIIQLQNAKPAPAINTSSNETLNKLRAELEAAIAENAALKQQIDSVETAAGSDQTSQIKVAGNNWDLEQATKRYQEAQREIRRLGAMVQKEQALREQDKKDMEAKLFDPAVTDQAQLDKLNAMEQRLAELEQGAPAAQAAPLMPMAVPVPQVVKAPAPQVASIAPAAGNPQDSREEIAPLIEEKKIAAAKPTMPVASAVISPIASVNFQSQQDYGRMLKTAGINIRVDVEAVSSSNSDNYRAYRWKTDSLYGSAELRAMKSGKGFDEAVNEYLERAKTRCGGDFAAVPSDVSVGAEKAKAFEIACIGGKTDTSASVLFTYGNDVMTTLAHEGKSEAMNTAMEARDRMAAQMGSLKTASK